MLPVVLSIAGSDCSAGAGVQADLKTCMALGCYGLTALTSVVAEVPAKVSLIQLLSAEMVQAQISVLAGAFPIAVAKTGMLGGREQIEAVVSAWTSHFPSRIPLVVDPVMVATSGGRLLQDEAMEALTTKLFPLASLLTPNMDEAGALLGWTLQTRADMEQAARELADLYGCAVLVKGGHLASAEAPDVLVEKPGMGESLWLEGQRIPDVHTHGTGCTYSSAIAAGLAHGLSLSAAVIQGKAYVTRSISQHHRWGPVDALNHTVSLTQ